MNEKDLLTGLSHIDEKYVEDARCAKKPYFRTVIIRWAGIAAVLAMIFGIIGSLGNIAAPVQAEDLMEGIQANPVEPTPLDAVTPKVMDFGLRLLNQVNEGNQNTLISPLSVLYALAMTANGAEGETLAEMELVLGMETQEMNDWLYSFARKIDASQLKAANSIWFADDVTFQVNQNFLQTNADYFGADLYKSAFDQTTLDDINNWCKNRTDGMIPKVLEEIPEGMVMYLINALCFDAEWEEQYEKNQVRPDQFYLANGMEITTEFLFSKEKWVLMDENAVGFLKPYKGEKYAFAALLPEDGMHVSQYLESLTGEKLNGILSGAVWSEVSVSIPSFETDTDAELIEPLKEMGMVKLFDKDQADLTRLGRSPEGNIWVNKLLHKTYMKLDAHGTKAAAIAIGGASRPTSAPVPPEIIYLDRPFVYMIVDLETGVPVFLGVMMNPSA